MTKKLLCLMSMWVLLSSNVITTITYAEENEKLETEILNTLEETDVETEEQENYQEEIKNTVENEDEIDSIIQEDEKIEEINTESKNNEYVELDNDEIDNTEETLSTPDLQIINKSEELSIFQYEDDEAWQEFTTWCYVWRTLWNGKIEIISYDKNTCWKDNVIIPETIEWRIVTKIWEYVFRNTNWDYYWIRSVIIPDTVEVIWTWAFYGSNFSSDFVLTLPSNLKRIEESAFMISNISWFNGLPDWLIYIWDNAFSNNSTTSTKNKIYELIIPNTVKYIWEYAFHSNPISTLKIWNSVEEIWDYAFQSYYMESTFENLYIPESVKKIWQWAFQSNKKLEYVEVWSWNWTIEIQSQAFSNCKIKELKINKDKIYFKKNSWWYWSNIYNPYDIIEINANEIYIEEWINEVFSNSRQHPTKLILNIPELNINLFRYLYVNSIELDERINEIDWKQFYYYWTWLTLPWTVKIVWNEAFKESKIENLKLEEWVEIIGTWVFSDPYTSKIKTIQLPESLKYIWEKAFYKNINQLTWLYIPSNVKKIWNEAFYNAYSLRTLNLSEWLEEIWTWAFMSAYNLPTIKMPSTVKKIWENAFQNWYSLSTLNLSEWLEEIWIWAFYNTHSIREFLIPDTLKKIWNNAFCDQNYTRLITWYITKDVPQEWIDNSQSTCIKFVRKYKIIFTWNIDWIEIPEKQIVDLNETATDPNVQEIEWYTFWWYKIWESTPYDFSTPITENIILEGKLVKNSYKVKYLDTNWSVIDEKMVEFWKVIPEINPEKECNIFIWWKDLPETMPAHDITTSAIWNYTCSRSSWWWRKSTSENKEHNAATQEAETEIIKVVDNQNINQENKQTSNNEIESNKTDIKYNNAYTKEQNDAYSFAKSNWITTTKSIEEAKMNTAITRIEMAKMLSNYAINILWYKPDLSNWTIDFKDVAVELDNQYNNWVTLAYQLWIMWINMENNKFRPYDKITRAEFITALSRLLYNTKDWTGKTKYYEPHMTKLYNEWIIKNKNPKKKEVRWDVLIMLMRATNK